MIKYCLIMMAVTMVASVFMVRSANAGGSKAFSIYPIGVVQKHGKKTTIVLQEKYEPGLMGLGDFSHIYVYYWFDRNDTSQKRATLQVHPKGNKKNPLRGVFATRSPVRPNLIAMSLCRVVSIEGNVIEVDTLDAFPDTPVIDIKPYIPENDTAENIRIPEWLEQILEDNPSAG